MQAPDGRVWRVRRRIEWPRRRRFSGGALDYLDGFSVLDSVDLGGIVAAIALGIILVALVAVLVVVFLPLFALAVEAAVAVVAAVALGRPWLVVAVTPGPPAEERRWRVRGLRGSRRAVREVAHELQLGVRAEPENAVWPGPGPSSN